MSQPPLTIRQQIIQAITGTLRSTRQLAELLRLRERDVEGHLEHVVRTVARDRRRRFVIDPASCVECGYVFRERRKLTTPSRCPTCKREGVSPPRFGIEEKP